MKRLSFIFQYIFRPRTVGAITPSSQYLARLMVKQIDFKHARYIVEYGPGTGVFTKQLLKRRRKETVIIIIESNETFYQHLIESYQDEPNLHVLNASAEDIEGILKQLSIPYVDFFVSGLPFASLPRQVSHNILIKTASLLSPRGKFITFQYSRINKSLFNDYFKTIEVIRELRNIPPAYVYSCSK
ncbi:rRNA adenine N-6-methyltransferase family protein [Bacillus mesophilus]|uniref:SAM-dependent methyltransferase n=1 Tax=Bacillus mesophilus TaxID=1808955 RepID=A0A6M0QC41_9BACI|nr:SAM-dependent methyltransferase [Bacillus mesophilus]